MEAISVGNNPKAQAQTHLYTQTKVEPGEFGPQSAHHLTTFKSVLSSFSLLFWKQLQPFHMGAFPIVTKALVAPNPTPFAVPQSSASVLTPAPLPASAPVLANPADCHSSTQPVRAPPSVGAPASD